LLASIRGEVKQSEPPPSKLPPQLSKPAYPSLPKDSETKAAKALKTSETVAKQIKSSVPVPKSGEMPFDADVPEEDTQHNAIKNRISTEAETLEYTVTSEEFVPGTKKRIDVVLHRGNRTIACEVSVTNTVEYEAATNITKCLEAGFAHVAAICSDRRKLAKIKQRVAEVSPADQATKVGFYVPDEFILKLFDWATEDPEGVVIERGKPRRRKIALNTVQLTDGERRQREDDMLSSLAEAMKRK